MQFRPLLCAFVPLLLCCAIAPAQESPAVSFSIPPADAPELAPRGRWSVGVRTLDLVNPGALRGTTVYGLIWQPKDSIAALEVIGVGAIVYRFTIGRSAAKSGRDGASRVI